MGADQRQGLERAGARRPLRGGRDAIRNRTKKPRSWSGAFALATAGCRLFRLADRDLQRADAVDAALDLVAGVKLGNASRRSRHDDVAGGESHPLRELPDDLGHVPDQFGQVALLGFGAVDREPDLALGGMADLRSRLHRGAGRGIVEGFSDFPRPLLFARGDLQVAAGGGGAGGGSGKRGPGLCGGGGWGGPLPWDGYVDASGGVRV